MAATDSRPIPKKNTAFRLRVYIEDETGDPVLDFTSPDSTISKDDASFADCTNEVTYVGNGYGYIDLTSDEMNCDGLVYRFVCDEGSYQVEICPEEAGDIRVNATQIGGQTVSASGTVTFPNATLASTTNITGGTITTVTSVTNPVTLTSAYDPAKTAAQAATLASIGTKVNAIDASTFGIKGDTFDGATDSLEAIRNRGDAAWVTGTAPDNASIASIKGVTDKVNTMLEGSGPYAYTEASLANAPGGASVEDIVDGILDETLAELTVGEAPATPQVRQLLMLLYMALRNASEADQSKRTVRNNAGTAILEGAFTRPHRGLNQGKLGTPS